MRLLLTEGQQFDHKGATTLLPDLPAVSEVRGDKGYNSDAYRAALIERGITPRIPPGAKRKTSVTYCKDLYKQRYKVEIMFDKLKVPLSSMHTYPVPLPGRGIACNP